MSVHDDSLLTARLADAIADNADHCTCDAKYPDGFYCLVTEEMPLFDAGPYQEPWALPPAVLDESPDKRRTRRQAEALARKRHPLSLVIGRTLPLHPEAASVDDRQAEGRRCGDCWFRELIFTNGNRKWAKCLAEMRYAEPDAPLIRVSHGAATDVRAWWPACIDHEWGDKVSDDAARCVPEAVAP